MLFEDYCVLAALFIGVVGSAIGISRIVCLEKNARNGIYPEID